MAESRTEPSLALYQRFTAASLITWDLAYDTCSLRTYP